jgi:WD40 repeat protein
VGTLQLLDAPEAVEGHQGEIYGCAYSPDGTVLVTAGWDGWLRLWETQMGTPVGGFRAANKPLASCAFSSDGKHLLSGSMDGMLGIWEVGTAQLVQTFVAHTRPISCILYTPDSKQFTTTSWDRQISVRKVGKEREGLSLSGHQDIVGGCRYSSDGRQLLSWSYDGSIRLWDLATGREASVFRGHADRVTAADLSPDCAWVVSGGRDGQLKIWDVETAGEVGSLSLPAEICACYFLLDGMSLAVVHVDGGLAFLGLDLQVQEVMTLGCRVQCAALAPSGRQLAVGSADGRPRLVALEGVSQAPLIVTASQHHRQDTSLLSRLLGRKRLTRTYAWTCPVCRTPAEVRSLPKSAFACSRCRQMLRLNSRLHVGSK